MSYLYELEGIYAQLQAMDLDDETFNDTLESIALLTAEASLAAMLFNFGNYILDKPSLKA